VLVLEVRERELVLVQALALAPGQVEVPVLARARVLAQVPALVRDQAQVRVLVMERAQAVSAPATAPAMTATDPRTAQATVPDPSRPVNPVF